MNPTVIELPAPELKTALTGLGKVISKRTTLPVLEHLRVTRDRAGRVRLAATDLDTTVHYASTSAVECPPCDFLVPYAALQQFAKGGREPVQLIRETKDRVRLKTHIGTSPLDQTFTVPAVDEFPPTPEVNGPPVALPAGFGPALRQALDCAGTANEWSRHVCLDTRPADGHYVVASDGGHFYCANSFRFDLKRPVLVPDVPFLHWPGFLAPEGGELRVQTRKDTGPWVQLLSGPWTCVTKSSDLAFPDWGHLLAKPSRPVTRLELDSSVVAALLAGLPKLPADREPRRPVTLEVLRGVLIAKARPRDAEEWTSLILDGAKVTGPDLSVTVNRDYLMKALRFGLTTLELRNAQVGVRCLAAGRQLLISPIVPVGGQPAPDEPAVSSNPNPPATPSPAQPQKGNPMPKSTETSPPAAPCVAATEPAAFDAAVARIESARTQLRELANTLGETLTLLKAAEREVQSVRATLRGLQKVQL